MIVPFLFALLGCGGPSEVELPADVRVKVEQARKGGLPADSLYTVSIPLVDDRGEPLGLDWGRGHPTLISMFYASCPTACPMLVNEVKGLEAKLRPEERADLRVLLVSLDPERDDPAALARAAERYGVHSERWRLTRTEPEHVRTLAALLDIQYRDLPNGEMNHSSVLTLLDRRGRVVARREGLGGTVDPLVEALRALP